MRYLILYINTFLLACLSIVSCSDIESIEADYEKAIELTVSCTNQNITRSTAPGEELLNENLISTLHYFLYKSGATDQNAVLMGKINIAQGTQKSAVVRIPLNEQELNNVVFPNPYNTCEVYLIANLPNGILPVDLTELDDTRLAKLKEKVIETNFKDNMPQPSFIMDGQAQATIVSRKKTVAAKGTIELERLAAKLTTRISVADSFTDTDGSVWTPEIKGMQIHLDNCVSNTTIGATLGDNHFDYDQGVYMGTKTETIDGQNVVYHVYAPFYSYPCQWEFNSDEALVIYVTLPWKCTKNGTIEYKYCYYKVYPSTMQLDRNSWYNLDMHIDVFGSFKETEEPVEITNFKYKVIDWKNGFDDWRAGLNINTELLSAHYLVVEQNHYVVNNKNTFEIPFITSHECIIRDYTGNTDGNTNNDFKVTKKIFIKNDQPVNEDQDITGQARNGSWITIEGNTIKLNHTLNNDFVNTDNYDYTPYEFTFYICHKNNPDKFQEKITITQKPALSVTAHLNSYDKPGQDYCGYVFVNGNAPGNTVNGTLPDYGGVQGRNASGNNSNPYMYTIEVSVLPKGSDFIIGDPRVKYEIGTHIAAQNNFYQAPQVNGGTNRRLTNYYGTSKDESIKNMIAPKFRVCSAHGWCAGGLVSYDDAFNRAASYQEDGYPAGRWRVPTNAEIWFVHKLYTDNFIPPLFYGTYAYWSSTGKVNGNNISDDKSSTSPLRCVYDDWYWENSGTFRLPEGNRNTFTWGDEI